MITITCDIDVVPGGLPQDIYLKQYESDYTLIFNLKNRLGTMTIESGSTAEIRGTKPDGTGFSASASINASEKTVTVNGDQQMTAAAGKAPFEVCIKKDGRELITASFMLNIQRAALDRATLVSESKILELYDVLDRVNEILQAAADTLEYSDLAHGYADDAGDFAENAEQSATNAASSATRAANAAETAAEDAAEAAEAEIARLMKSGLMIDENGDFYYYP